MTTRIGYRWTVCALLFVVTTINYVDRQVLGILAPTLQRELHWTESQYGDVVSWFSLVYAFGFLAAGRVLDRVGVRRGFAVAIVAWSVAAIAHAFARTAAGFSAARALLGLGESANFPGAIKTVAEWFPKRERALATGIFNAGTNTGAIITPLVVPWIALTWGWQWAFVATGSLGFLWLVVWLALYRSPETHPRVTPAELTHLKDDGDVPTAFAPLAGSLWAAVAIVSVAAAAHQAWSANVYTLASDMFPRAAVGSVVGIGAFAGAMGGVLFQRVTGRILQANGNDYTPIFIVCGLAYVSAWTVIHLLAPRLEPAAVEEPVRV